MLSAKVELVEGVVKMLVVARLVPLRSLGVAERGKWGLMTADDGSRCW